MENSGNNRYELLFMDDEGSAPSGATEVLPKKKPPTTANEVAPNKKAQVVNKKLNATAEKENKAGVLNKNEKKSVGPSQQLAKPKNVANTYAGNKTNKPTTGTAADAGGRHVSFKSHNNNDMREQRNNRRNVREGGPTEFGNEQQRQIRRDNRGQIRNNRFGEGGFRGGKREFDRQSGSDKTGVKAIDKRDGAGAHNWGSVKQEIEDINKSANETDTALTDKEESANEQSPDQVTAAEQEETKEMTLDEWKATQQRTKPKFNIRQAGEGEDTTKWKKMVVLDKKKEGGESEEELEYDPSLYPQRVGRLQRIVDIQFNFNDGRRGGFGRGRGRGGPIGGARSAAPGQERSARFEGGRTNAGGENVTRPNVGRPRFGDRPQRGGLNALKVDDERQFPTLN